MKKSYISFAPLIVGIFIILFTVFTKEDSNEKLERSFVIRSFKSLLYHVGKSVVTGEKEIKKNQKVDVYSFTRHRKYSSIVFGSMTTQEELYYCILLGHILVKEGGTMIFQQEPTKIQIPSWLVKRNSKEYVVTRSEHRCLSQVLADLLIKKVCAYEGDTVLYATSEEREQKLLRHYKNTETFTYETITGMIHAVILCSLFPRIKIVKGQFERSLMNKEEDQRLWNILDQWIKQFI